MKKLFSVLMAVVVLAAAGTTLAFAENNGTKFSYEHLADPAYTITIPAEVTLTKEGVDVTIEATHVANLNNRTISVTAAGTDYYRNQFVLEAANVSPRSSIRYQITTANGEVLATTGEKDQYVGVELVSFTDNGSESYNAMPIITDYAVAGAVYTGTFIYGITLN